MGREGGNQKKEDISASGETCMTMCSDQRQDLREEPLQLWVHNRGDLNVPTAVRRKRVITYS